MNHFKLNKNCTIKNLTEFGFQKCTNGNYRYSTPLCKYRDMPTITMTIVVSLRDKCLAYEVIDNNTDTLYAAYYGNDYSGNSNMVLDVVNNAVKEVLEKLKESEIIVEENENE